MEKGGKPKQRQAEPPRHFFRHGIVHFPGAFDGQKQKSFVGCAHAGDKTGGRDVADKLLLLVARSPLFAAFTGFARKTSELPRRNAIIAFAFLDAFDNAVENIFFALDALNGFGQKPQTGVQVGVLFFFKRFAAANDAFQAARVTRKHFGDFVFGHKAVAARVRKDLPGHRKKKRAFFVAGRMRAKGLSRFLSRCGEFFRQKFCRHRQASAHNNA